MISLVTIDQTNWDECINLLVAPEQKSFVASNLDSLKEAESEPGMHPIGISDGIRLVGFAMYGNEEEARRAWIIRFMIDTTYQKKGYGKEALHCLLNLLFEKYKQPNVSLCVEPENLVAIKFYESFGFVYTGDNWGNEMIYTLKYEQYALRV